MLRRRPEPHYEHLPSFDYHDLDGRDPNEYLNPNALWEEVQDCLADARLIMAESAMATNPIRC